jgi:hypothetical protein
MEYPLKTRSGLPARESIFSTAIPTFFILEDGIERQVFIFCADAYYMMTKPEGESPDDICVSE